MNALYIPDSETELGMMVNMTNKEIEEKYNKLLDDDNLPVYDGRGQGVDVYYCRFCRNKVYTRYKDKGVTPFAMLCPKCHKTMTHDYDITEEKAASIGVKVVNWVRPSLEWLLKHRKALKHVLGGGLVLENEL